MIRTAALSSALVLAAACAGGPFPVPPKAEPRAATSSGEAESAAPEPAADPALARALDEAAKGVWEELYILSECRTDAGLEAVEIFGDGVAIWEEMRQFNLSRSDIAALFEPFRREGFAAMRGSFGGRGDLPKPEPVDPGAANAVPELICRVSLRLDGLAKDVVQLRLGTQSEELRRLALAILDAVRGPAAAGVGAASLADGLGKVAAGELAPQVFHLLVSRRPERAGEEATGWLLRVDGLLATVRPYAPAAGYGDERRLALTAGELGELARRLAEADLGGLPANLYSGLYTDFSLEILDQGQRVQARRFAGMTATTHGAAQERFDRALEALAELAERLLAAG